MFYHQDINPQTQHEDPPIYTNRRGQSPTQISINCITLIPMIFIYTCWFLPSTIQIQLEKEPYSLSIFEFNSIYAIGCLPNTVFIFVSTWITLKIGIRKAVIFYGFSMGIAQLLMHASIYIRFQGWFYLFIFGKFHLGLFSFATMIMIALLIIKFIEPSRIAFIISRTIAWGLIISACVPILSIDQTIAQQFPFTAVSLLALLLMARSILSYYSVKRLENQISQTLSSRQLIFTLKDIPKLGRIMLIIFIAVFLATSIQNSIMMNACDNLHKRVGIEPQYTKLIVSASMLCAFFTSFVCLIFSKEINYGKIRTLFILFAVTCFIDIPVLYFVPKILDYETYPALALILSLLGFVALNFWYWGMMSLILGLIPIVIKHELLPLAFTIYFSSLALGSGSTPLLIAKMISSSPDIKEGYKNSYYIYFSLLLISIILLMLLRQNFAKLLQQINKNKQTQYQKQQQQE